MDFFEHHVALLGETRLQVPNLNDIVPVPGRHGHAADVVSLGQTVLKLLPYGGKQKLLPNHRRVLFWAFEPPSSSIAEDWVLPERLPALSHEVVVGPQGELYHVGYVVVHGPKALCSGDCVNFLKVGLVFCCGGTFTGLVNPEGPSCVERHSRGFF